jgi:hypothetical protein
MSEPCPVETELLYQFWNLFWNGPGSCDGGTHATYTWDEMGALADAAERVENHQTEHGCRGA